MVKINRIRFEHLESPALGIGESRPRISWSYELEDEERDCDWLQERYRIELRWTSSGEVESQAVDSTISVFVPWAGRPLTSGEEVSVRIRALGKRYSWTEWSEVATVEAGLLSADDWKCSLIEPGNSYPSGPPHKPVLFRRDITIDKAVKKARLYITAHGVYEARLNGKVVGDMVMNPGWTSYNHRFVYHTLPIVPEAGVQMLGVYVAEGWYCGRLGYGGGVSNIYGDRIGLIAQLVINFEDGSRQTIGTDGSWTWAEAPTQLSSIYDGETYDYGLQWSEKLWHKVQTKPLKNNLVAPLGPPVRRVKILPAREIVTSPSGKTIVDFGQNFVGRVRIWPKTERTGQFITLRHAEVLENGEIVTRTLRIAKAEDNIIQPSNSAIVWEPAFTFHGFRYVEVEGYTGTLQLGDIEGIVLQTDMVQTGHFSCSNELLNKLHHNVEWSMRGNFLSIPTDCPQRDERLGWTGDLNVFIDTANFLFDTGGMLSSWLTDLSLEQADSNGLVPLVIPAILPHHTQDAHPIWGDASIMVPWSIYQVTGDRTFLSKQYDSMKAWLDTIPRHENGLWNYKASWKLGDWLDPLSPPDDPGNATTDPELIGSVFLIYVTRLIAHITSVLHGEAASELYINQVSQLLDAFAYEYMAPSGLLVADTQTAYALALHFHIYKSPKQQTRASDRLVDNVLSKSHFKIATGFAGTPYILHALSEAGHSNIAYRMLLERKCPSWLYPVSMGATTLWERWDSMLPDGSINPGEMTSFNHYALGAVADWMHKSILGMRAAEPGWGVWRVEPVPGGALKWAEGRFLSPYGLCTVRWDVRDKDGGEVFMMRVEVPPNTRCQVKLPNGDEREVTVGSGVHKFECVYVPQEWPVRAKYPRHMKPDDDIPENHE